MNMKKLILIVAAFLIGTGISYASTRYVGGDISLLPNMKRPGQNIKTTAANRFQIFFPFCEKRE